MADSRSNIASNVSEVEYLETLADKYKGKGRGKASESERRRFIDCWVSACKREALRSKAFELLSKGFSIAAAEPLYEYVVQTGEQELYNKAFISIRSNEGGAGELKLALSLLAFELIAPSSDDSVDLVARRVSGAALGKNGRPLSTLTSGVGTQLVRPLAKASISPQAHIESLRASSLANRLRPGLDAVINKESAKAGDVRAAKEIIAWLGEQKAESIESEAAGSSAKAEPAQEAETNRQGQVAASADSAKGDSSPNSSEAKVADAIHSDGHSTIAADSPRPSAKNEGKDRAKQAKKGSKNAAKSKADDGDDSLDLPTVISFLSKLDQDQTEREKQYESMRSECHALSVKVSDLEQKLRASQGEVEDLKSQRSSLSGNYSALQQQCDTLNVENQSLREQLRDANEMIDIMDEGATHEVDSTIDSLGMELSYDYRKFLDAEAEPMTVELGNIALRQLRTVFDILKKHGIELQ